MRKKLPALIAPCATVLGLLYGCHHCESSESTTTSSVSSSSTSTSTSSSVSSSSGGGSGSVPDPPPYITVDSEGDVPCVEDDVASGLTCCCPGGPVASNWSTRIADCGGPVDGGPGPVTDCRQFASVCHQCWITNPYACEPATYCGSGGTPCTSTADCTQPVSAYPGVSGIGCINGACLWIPDPPSSGDCADGGAPPP